MILMIAHCITGVQTQRNICVRPLDILIGLPSASRTCIIIDARIFRWKRTCRVVELSISRRVVSHAGPCL